MKRQISTISIAVLALVAIFAAPATASAQSPVAHPSVIGGSPATIAAFPSLADIQGEESPGNFFGCTGTVVAPRVILTAGHCVEDLESATVYSASGYGVATGIADISALQHQNVSLVSKVLVYPGFSTATLRGDAGLLILSAPVSAPTLALATAPDSSLLQPQTPLTIAGWGLTEGTAKEAPTGLQSASTIVQSSAYCKQHSAKYYPFYSAATQLCTIDPGHAISTCHGDSGGPAIALRADGTPVEVGITSLGGPNCKPSLPDVFTRVDQVSSWVASWIAATESGAAPPAVKVPQEGLPTLSFSRAKYLAGLGLAEDFGYRFRSATDKRIGCVRVEREKVKCGVSWFQGGNNYYGTITIYFAIYHNTVAWNDRYTIHWVNDQCYSSGQACPVHTKTR